MKYILIHPQTQKNYLATTTMHQKFLIKTAHLKHPPIKEAQCQLASDCPEKKKTLQKIRNNIFNEKQVINVLHQIIYKNIIIFIK